MYNRRLANESVKQFVRAGPMPSAPINHLAMLGDYIDPGERIGVCPNQDVVYGIGLLALEKSPVVIQVPDFGSRFWVFAAYDTRTDAFVQLGKMYGTTPGFYLVVGPNWKGDLPKRNHQGIPIDDIQRLLRPAGLSGRYARGPAGDPERPAPDHDVPPGRNTTAR
jgi:hypothetical protein